MIGDKFISYTHDPYSYVKYFIRLQHLIEQDEVFQKVLQRTDQDQDDDFENALDKSVEEEKSLIHKAFNSDDELWCAMKEDDSGDDKEELDVFKMYFMYYVNLQ